MPGLEGGVYIKVIVVDPLGLYGRRQNAGLPRALKVLPINLVLDRDDGVSPDDPFFRVIPCVIGRLKSPYIRGRPRHLQDITAHLSHPAPLLEGLSICGSHTFPLHQCHVLTSELFNGHLSLLRKLSLESIHTEFPWRNMVNLTSLTLFLASPNETSVRHLLDFLEGAPHLRVIELGLATLTSDTQNGRLVPLKCLERMYINSSGPVSLLLDHLLIPVGARLRTRVHCPGIIRW